MKKALNYFGILFLLSISLHSCKPDDVYYNLSDDAKGFVNFKIGDTFKLKNLNTNEIITLSVISKNISNQKYSSGESAFISFGYPPADKYVQKGKYSFTDSLNNYQGEISVIANDKDGFTLTAVFNGFNDNLGYYYWDSNVMFPTIYIEGIQYQNAYLLNSNQNDLYYSKEKGILKIVDVLNNLTLFSYVP